MRLVPIALLIAGTLVAGESGGYHWNLPRGFPIPRVPAGNPMSEVKARLGRYLFYDQRLSVNGKQSCATCHRQELAFTDGRATSVGATGEMHPRSAMSLVNVAYSAALTWSDPALRWCPVALAATILVQAVDYYVRRRPVARVLSALRGTALGTLAVTVVFAGALALKISLDAKRIAAGGSGEQSDSFIYFRF